MEAEASQGRYFDNKQSTGFRIPPVSVRRARKSCSNRRSEPNRR